MKIIVHSSNLQLLRPLNSSKSSLGAGSKDDVQGSGQNHINTLLSAKLVKHIVWMKAFI